MFFKSFLAGFSISIGAFVYLKVGGIAGAILFAFGLLCICLWQWDLYTGRAGWYSIKSLGPILVGNIFGCLPLSFFIDASNIVESRVDSGILNCCILSIACGFIMTTAVQGVKNNNYLPLIFGIPTFILCGFPHCIADAFYYLSSITTVAEYPIQIGLTWLSTVVGNWVGCNLYKLVK
jgi:formate/nitrite transporter FocA (FNT family)